MATVKQLKPQRVASAQSSGEIPLTMMRTSTATYFYFGYGPLTGVHGGARM